MLHRFAAHGLLSVMGQPHWYRIGDLSRLAAQRVARVTDGVKPVNRPRPTTHGLVLS